MYIYSWKKGKKLTYFGDPFWIFKKFKFLSYVMFNLTMEWTPRVLVLKVTIWDYALLETSIDIVIFLSK